MPHSKGFARRDDRRTGDPVPLRDVMAALMREDVFSRGLPIAKLAESWPEIVGERLAAATTPESLEAGVLTIRAADGPWGSQARSLTEQIQQQVVQSLGDGVVTNVRVVVGDPRNRR